MDVVLEVEVLRLNSYLIGSSPTAVLAECMSSTCEVMSLYYIRWKR